MNPAPPSTWHRHAFRAMGSHMAAWLEMSAVDTAATALARVEALFASYEQALSRFRPDSELSRLNAAGGGWATVSDLMWDVLTLSLGMAAITRGRFDPTLLTALEHSGYSASFEMLGGSSGRGAGPAETLSGRWAEVGLDEARQAVYLPPGLRLDLGGIGKGYTARQAVAALRELGPCLVDAGGDLAAGAAPAGYPGWPVAISAPWPGDGREPADLATLWLVDGALATSGVDYRTWRHDGRRAHHLIDPATGLPAATDGLTVTVLAADAAQAEAWATATLVAGSGAGLDALLDADLAGLMVLQDGRVLMTPAMQPYFLRS